MYLSWCVATPLYQEHSWKHAICHSRMWFKLFQGSNRFRLALTSNQCYQNLCVERSIFWQQFQPYAFTSCCSAMSAFSKFQMDELESFSIMKHQIRKPHSHPVKKNSSKNKIGQNQIKFRAKSLKLSIVMSSNRNSRIWQWRGTSTIFPTP